MNGGITQYGIGNTKQMPVEQVSKSMYLDQTLALDPFLVSRAIVKGGGKVLEPAG